MPHPDAFTAQDDPFDIDVGEDEDDEDEDGEEDEDEPEDEGGWQVGHRPGPA